MQRYENGITWQTFLGLYCYLYVINTNTMKNKVEVRAFAVEQVVKMRCMSDCSSEEIIREAKRIEEYVVGDVCIPEFGDETTDMMRVISAIKDALKHQLEKESQLPTYEEVMAKLKDEQSGYGIMGCALG